jgi:hypothetical protein
MAWKSRLKADSEAEQCATVASQFSDKIVKPRTIEGKPIAPRIQRRIQQQREKISVSGVNLNHIKTGLRCKAS